MIDKHWIYIVITEKLYLKMFFLLRAWILIAFSLLGVACSTYVPSYSKQLNFESGKQSLEIDVNRLCTYEVGIMFLSQVDDQTVKDFFGDAMHIHLPALIDMSLFDDSGKIFFSTVDFGGTVSGYRYGPNPLMLIAGKVYLAPGKYTVVIEIKDVENDFSGFESSFFVSVDPKVKCGKKL